MTSLTSIASAILTIVLSTAAAAVAAAPPTLRSAQVSITLLSPVSCDVSMTVAVDGSDAIDHRLEMPAGTEISALRTHGARTAGEPETRGATRSILLSPEQVSYQLSYRVVQPESRRFRCPLWLPAVPADGISRNVRLEVALPAGAIPGATMPRIAWNGSAGHATLAHLPAFVLMPYSMPGESPGWDITAAMDVSAVIVFVGASAVWLWRRSGRSSGSSGSSGSGGSSRSGGSNRSGGK